MKATKFLAAALLVAVAAQARADEVDGAGALSDKEAIAELKRQIEVLTQKVKVLERKDELASEQREKAKLEEPVVKADSNGLSVQSQDKKFSFKLKGLLQFDSRWYIDDGGIANNDTFTLRRARPIFEGTLYDHYEFRLMPDFGGNAVVIQDAFVNINYAKELQVQFGKYKTPVGLEFLQSDPNMPFIERGLPNNLVAQRDLGIMVHGRIWDGVIQYQAGVFNGLGDGRATNNFDIDDDKDAVGRLFLEPFKKEPGFLQGLGFGVAGSYGHRSGQPNGLTAGYLTDGQQVFFTYRASAAPTNGAPNVAADGSTWRLAPQAYYYYGPFGLLGEWTLSSTGARVSGAGTNARFDRYNNTAWQIAGNWVITGEDASFKGVVPKREFGLEDGDGLGAFEVTARFGQLNIDGDAFRAAPGSSGALIASAATLGSARDNEAWGIGLNWYLTKNFRASIDYFQSSFYGGNGSNPVVLYGEDAVLTRFQLNF